MEDVNLFFRPPGYWHQSKFGVTSGFIFCKHLLIGFANLRPLWTFYLISFAQDISSSIKVSIFLPCHTDTLSRHLLLAPPLTKDIKLSASSMTKARQTVLLSLPNRSVWGVFHRGAVSGSWGIKLELGFWVCLSHSGPQLTSWAVLFVFQSITDDHFSEPSRNFWNKMGQMRYLYVSIKLFILKKLTELR